MAAKLTEDKKMTLQDKLDYLDDELHKLHMFCIKAGYSPVQIEKFAEPFLKKEKVANRSKWLWRFISIILLITTTYLLFYIDPLNKFMCFMGRRAAIQVMPVYDWTRLYDWRCLVNNPLLDTQNYVIPSDCDACENFKSIRRIQKVTERELIEKYIKQDKPVIVTDGLNESKKFTLKFLAEVFVDSLYDGCEFNSNLKVHGHRSFLKQVLAEEHDSYFASWRNCFEEPAKELRFHCKKPYFLTSTVELSDTNWLYVSSNYTAKKSKPINIQGPLVILMQMKGSIKLVLLPDEVCSDICTDIIVHLKEGEIFLVNAFLWIIQYYPSNGDESITFGISGNFD